METLVLDSEQARVVTSSCNCDDPLARHDRITGVKILIAGATGATLEIAYGDLSKSYVRTRRSDPRQMKFQFALSDLSPEQITVKRFTPKGETSAELVFSIEFRKLA